MESLSDLSKYHELRKRIIRNEDLSDSEWELFFELEMKNKEMRKQKESWDNLFLNSVLVPESKKTSVMKHFSLKEAVSAFKPLMKRKYQFAYTGLILFFFIGFLSYSALNRTATEVPETSGKMNVEIKPKQEPGPADRKLAIRKNTEDQFVYAENPFLENYISDVVRSVSNSMEITSPQPSLRYNLKEGKDTSTLNFSGTLQSQENPEGNISLKIFSNKSDDYSDDQPLYKENIEFQQNDSKWIFSKEINFPLKKGLYYFSIEETKKDEILYLNKFYIY